MKSYRIYLPMVACLLGFWYSSASNALSLAGGGVTPGSATANSLYTFEATWQDNDGIWPVFDTTTVAGTAVDTNTDPDADPAFTEIHITLTDPLIAGPYLEGRRSESRSIRVSKIMLDETTDVSATVTSFVMDPDRKNMTIKCQDMKGVGPFDVVLGFAGHLQTDGGNTYDGQVNFDGRTIFLPVSRITNVIDITTSEPFTDQNDNQQYDVGEPYLDQNGNEQYDATFVITGEYVQIDSMNGRIKLPASSILTGGQAVTVRYNAALVELNEYNQRVIYLDHSPVENVVDITLIGGDGNDTILDSGDWYLDRVHGAIYVYTFPQLPEGQAVMVRYWQGPICLMMDSDRHFMGWKENPATDGATLRIRLSAGLNLADERNGVPGFEYASGLSSTTSDPDKPRVPKGQFLTYEPVGLKEIKPAASSPTIYGSGSERFTTVERVNPDSASLIRVTHPIDTFRTPTIRGVYDNSGLTGTNYFTNGSIVFSPEEAISLGTALPQSLVNDVDGYVWVEYMREDSLGRYGGVGGHDFLWWKLFPWQRSNPLWAELDPEHPGPDWTDFGPSYTAPDPYDPMAPNDGATCTAFEFKVRYFNNANLPPRPWLTDCTSPANLVSVFNGVTYYWSIPNPTGVVLFLDVLGTGDYRPYHMQKSDNSDKNYSASDDSEADGCEYIFRIEPSGGWQSWYTGDSDEPTTGPYWPIINLYESLALGRYHYYFACSDDSFIDADTGEFYRNIRYPWIAEPSGSGFEFVWLQDHNVPFNPGREYLPVVDFNHVDTHAYVDARTIIPDPATTGFEYSAERFPAVYPNLAGIDTGLMQDDYPLFMQTVSPYYFMYSPVYYYPDHSYDGPGGHGHSVEGHAQTSGGAASTVFTFKVLYRSKNPDTGVGKRPTYVKMYINDASDYGTTAERIGETYTDTNRNGRYDIGETFVDQNANNQYDQGEPFTDANNNNTFDAPEPFVDTNANNQYDASDPNHQLREYVMSAAPGQSLDYANGVVYQVTLGSGSLSAGPHSYFFEAHDGTRKCHLPVRPDGRLLFSPDRAYCNAWEDEWVPGGPGKANNNDYFPGPYVNHAPVMTNMKVTPTSGSQGTNFRFDATYSDEDGQRPYFIDVLIETVDGGTEANGGVVRGRMSKVNADDRDYKNGVQYFFDMRSLSNVVLQPGTRHFKFEVQDDWGEVDSIFIKIPGELVRYPAGGDNWVAGPQVDFARAPRLINGDVLSSDQTSTSATLWTYKVTYVQTNEVPPTYVNVYIGKRSGVSVTFALERNQPIDGRHLKLTNLPVLSVTGVWDNPFGTGTNFYTGGSFNASSGIVTLGRIEPSGTTPAFYDVYVTYTADPITWDSGHAMSKVDEADNVYRDGVDYKFQTRLAGAQASGEQGYRYVYAFEASDGSYSAVYNPNIDPPNTDESLRESSPFAYAVVTQAEPFLDANGNGRYDTGESYVDQNGNDRYDDGAEPFDDANANGVYDVAEPFEDLNFNSMRDPGELFADENLNGRYDTGEPYFDEDSNGQYDGPEPYTDVNFDGFYEEFSEGYTDATGPGNHAGVYDVGGELLTPAGNGLRYSFTNDLVAGPLPLSEPLSPGVIAGPKVYINGGLQYPDTRMTQTVTPANDNRTLTVRGKIARLVLVRTNSLTNPTKDYYSTSPWSWYYHDPAYDESVIYLAGDSIPPGTQAVVDYVREGTYSLDYVNGEAVFHSELDESDIVTADYWFSRTGPETVGYNNPPELSTQSRGVTPEIGGAATDFVFRVTYKDPDGTYGQPPSYVRIYIDGVAYEMARVGSGGTPNYKAGEVYSYTTELSAAAHAYHFDASDGAGFAILDWDKAQSKTRARNSTVAIASYEDIPGPFVNDTPILSAGAVAPTGVPTAIGVGTPVTYSVIYTDADNNAADTGYPLVWVDSPTGHQTSSLVSGTVTGVTGDSVTITGLALDENELAGALIQLEAGEADTKVYAIISNTGGEASDTITITMSTSTLLTDGIEVGDTYQLRGMRMTKRLTSEVTYTPRWTATTQIDRVDNIVRVSADTVSGVLGVYLDPSTNGVDYFANGGSFEVNLLDKTKLDIYLSQALPQGAGTVYVRHGVLYELVAPTLLEGTHTFHFSIVSTPIINGLATPMAVRLPLQTAVPNEYTGPVVVLANPNNHPPVLVAEPIGPAYPGMVTPTLGRSTDTYRFRIYYSDEDNDPPANHNGVTGYIRAVVTPTNQAPIELPLTSVSGSSDFTVPQVFASDPSTLTPPGMHTFHFEVSDGWANNGGVVRYPEDEAQDPTVSVNAKPVLSLPGVSPTTGNDGSVYVFTVTYTDSYNSSPGTPTVSVRLDGTTNRTLTQQSGNPVTGAVYSVTLTSDDFPNLGGGSHYGLHTYQFLGSDGLETGTTAVLNGPTIENKPYFTNPSVDPTTGTVDTTYTYRVTFTDKSGVPVTKVQLVVDSKVVGDMAKDNAADNDAADSIAYHLATKLTSSGLHSYDFIAQPSGTRLPATLFDPRISASLIITPTKNPAALGDVIDVTVQLIPAKATAVRLTIARPDGSPEFDQSIQTAANGTYTRSGINLDQSGAWTVTAHWAANPPNDPAITETLDIQVSGPTHTLWMVTNPLGSRVGKINMICPPVTAKGGDPANVFMKYGDKWIVDHVYVARYVPALGQYTFYDQDPSFPLLTKGAAFFVRPKDKFWTGGNTYAAQAFGALPDQTQSLSIPLQAGWNQFGSTFLSPVPWSSVRVSYQGRTIPIAEAARSGYIRDYAWGWNPNWEPFADSDSDNDYDPGETFTDWNDNSAFDGAAYFLVHTSHNLSGVRRNLEPWVGYWIRCFVSGLQLVIPAPASGASTANGPSMGAGLMSAEPEAAAAPMDNSDYPPPIVFPE